MISSVFKLSSNFQAFPMSCLQIISWISDLASDGSCCCGSWTTEINLRFGAAHAPNEVAVHCCESALTRTQQPTMTTDTRATSDHADGTTRVMEDLNQTVLHGFIVNLHTGRCN